MSKLQQSIATQRTLFLNEERKAIDAKREHDTMLTTIPRSFIYNLCGRTEFELKLVTSTRTDNAFKSGKDDELLVH